MRSNALRMIVAALFAIPVAFGLFAIMNKLIDRDFENPEIKNRKVAEIVRPEASSPLAKQSWAIFSPPPKAGWLTCIGLADNVQLDPHSR